MLYLLCDVDQNMAVMCYAYEWDFNGKIEISKYNGSVKHIMYPWLVKLYATLLLPVTPYYVMAGLMFGYISERGFRGD